MPNKAKPETYKRKEIGDVKTHDYDNRSKTIIAIEKANAQFAMQDNVMVIVPATDKELGYTVFCSRDTANRKYKDYEIIELLK